MHQGLTRAHSLTDTSLFTHTCTHTWHTRGEHRFWGPVVPCPSSRVTGKIFTLSVPQRWHLGNEDSGTYPSALWGELKELVLVMLLTVSRAHTKGRTVVFK